MFWYMNLEVIRTPRGDVVKNTLILDDEREIYLPNIEINEDELLEYDDVKYELNYIKDVFNDGDGHHVYYYSLTPVEVPITRLKLDKYIDKYFKYLRDSFE